MSLRAVRGPIADQASAGKRKSALLLILQLTFATVTIAGSLGYMASMLRDCWDPRQIDYGEGIVLWQAQHILDPSLTYRKITTPPYNVTHYPPLYHLATRALETVTHNWVAAGRLVSVTSGMGIVLAIGTLVFAVLPCRVSRADRWTAAIFAGCSIFLHPFTTYWMRTARVDFLGLFLSIAAMAIYVSRRQVGWLLAAVTLFVLAGFTKQSLITIPLACLLLEAFLNWRRVLAAAAWGAVLAAIPLIAMQYRTHGDFLFNLIYYNRNPLDLAVVKIYLLSLLRSPWILFAIAAPAIVITVTRLWRRHAYGLGWWRRRCEESALLRMLLLVTLHIAISLGLLTVAAAKRGASTNYALPLILSLSPLAGIVVWRVFAVARARPGWDFTVLCSFSVILLACQPTLNEVPRILLPGYTGDQQKYAEERRQLIDMVRSTPGTVYSEDMVLLIQAGKDVFAEPAIITILADAAQWDERPFLDMLARKEFPLILAGDLGDPIFFTPGVARSIQANYETSGQLDHLHIYRPRR
jgi:hypothetical protein